PRAREAPLPDPRRLAMPYDEDPQLAHNPAILSRFRPRSRSPASGPSGQAPPAPSLRGVESAKAGCSKGSRCEAATRARPRRMPHTPQGGAEVANEADGPFSATCLELDELGEHDVRHGADLVEGGGRHGVVEVQEGHRAAAA